MHRNRGRRTSPLLGSMLAILFSARSINVVAQDVAVNASNGPRKLASTRLPNGYQVNDRVLCGGLPADDAAFAELAALGVKTVVSVDGAEPNVTAARQAGLRYVHLPHGYDGIADARVRELARALRDLDGPVYIHCHHGKHRSPAAAAAALIALGRMTNAEAATWLKQAGTDPNYRGLYATVDRTKPLTREAIDAAADRFPERAEVESVVAAMVDLEHRFDELKAASQGERYADAAHAALLIRERYREILRTGGAEGKPEAFHSLMKAGEAAAARCEEACRVGETARSEGRAPSAEQQATIRATFDRVRENCVACHRTYRDNR